MEDKKKPSRPSRSKPAASAKSVPAKPKVHTVTAEAIQAEHVAIQAAVENLRPLSPSARSRAIDYLRSWSYDDGNSPTPDF